MTNVKFNRKGSILGYTNSSILFIIIYAKTSHSKAWPTRIVKRQLKHCDDRRSVLSTVAAWHDVIKVCLLSSKFARWAIAQNCWQRPLLYAVQCGCKPMSHSAENHALGVGEVDVFVHSIMAVRRHNLRQTLHDKRAHINTLNSAPIYMLGLQQDREVLKFTRQKIRPLRLCAKVTWGTLYPVSIVASKHCVTLNNFEKNIARRQFTLEKQDSCVCESQVQKCCRNGPRDTRTQATYGPAALAVIARSVKQPSREIAGQLPICVNVEDFQIIFS